MTLQVNLLLANEIPVKVYHIEAPHIVKHLIRAGLADPDSGVLLFMKAIDLAQQIFLLPGK